MESLAGKNALITGAGKGVGRAVALALAKEGANVALLSRTEAQLKEVAAEVEGHGVKAVVVAADVADLNAVNAAVEKAKNALGSINILINSAGVAAFGKFLELEPEKWEEIVRINLLGVYYATRAVLPGMIKRQSGDIINISSTAGQRGAAVTSAYSASKFAVLGLTESLMQEVRKHNIRVTALTPSTIVTDMAYGQNLITGDPERVMHPEDFAELIIAQLKLNRRVFVKEAGIWSTNP
ncbi:3-oxoacyl-[acyl-carrier protein] reductase [Pontibacter ummariensis]|uniref:3-oxoacyl-[acyl-carrier protein] reductase n=1 Tax=Pontibacter ummariensis TaxID=1610492 RepID=A0A239BSJ2_9BACT|nr:3-ketoacyl-ACP reductase [Pontibacter ummariensis]PRY15685.1 3-oxoacyl-[acyl-carrier protein] reductase [Pontibacter ummariensis]SNS10034.1 3-oxoacyl-[acyl-carrier protein] reductase [Pontibacter ummariensis]